MTAILADSEALASVRQPVHPRAVSDKKREIIFEVPKAELPASVQDLMTRAEARMKAADETAADLLGEPLEIDFHVKNNRVIYSMRDTGDTAPAVAKSIIRAVRSFEVKPLDVKPRTQVTSQLGAPTVKFERRVLIDWKQQTIFTNFPPDDGSTFLAAMAIVVEELQRGKRTEGEPKS
jgi:hypothetical protein